MIFFLPLAVFLVSLPATLAWLTFFHQFHFFFPYFAVDPEAASEILLCMHVFAPHAFARIFFPLCDKY